MVILFLSTNTSDLPFSNSLSQVKVGDHVCGSITYQANQRMYSVDCDGAEGSQVTVKKFAALSLCEVKVFGKLKCF